MIEQVLLINLFKSVVGAIATLAPTSDGGRSEDMRWRAVIEGHLIEQVLLLNLLKIGGGRGAIAPCPFPIVPSSLMTY